MAKVLGFFVFLHKTEWVCMVLRIQNLWSVQKVQRFYVVFCSWLISLFYLSQTNLLWLMGELTGEGFWLLALMTGVRWHVTCDMWLVICETWFFFKCQKSHKIKKKKKCNQKMAKSAQKYRKVSKGGIS